MIYCYCFVIKLTGSQTKEGGRNIICKNRADFSGRLLLNEIIIDFSLKVRLKILYPVGQSRAFLK